MYFAALLPKGASLTQWNKVFAQRDGRRQKINVTKTLRVWGVKLFAGVGRSVHTQCGNSHECHKSLTHQSCLHTEIPHQGHNEGPSISCLTHWTSRIGTLLCLYVITQSEPALPFRISRCVMTTASAWRLISQKRSLFLKRTGVDFTISSSLTWLSPQFARMSLFTQVTCS